MVENIVNHENNPGILLLAGKGSRLHPLTDVVNKNLLPIYDKPLALHSLEFLECSGINKIVVICNPNDVDSFTRLFEANRQTKTKIYYSIQEKPLGTADGIKLARRYITENHFFCLWGDNVFEFNLESSVGKSLERSARLHLVKVTNPKDFGVVEINKEGKILSIEDKPQSPKSYIVCTGFMCFRSEVFDTIEQIQPNQKGEYDIMDTVRSINAQDMLEYELIRGRWIDTGVSFDTLLEASILAKEKGLNK